MKIAQIAPLIAAVVILERWCFGLIGLVASFSHPSRNNHRRREFNK
jgi:hypothetical protein